MSYPTCGREQCSTKQTFCALSMETVNKVPELKTQFNFIDSNIITANDWNIIKSKLNDIHNFGKHGTRNPTTDKINTFVSATSTETMIKASYYNKIYDIIDSTEYQIDESLYTIINDNIDSVLNDAFNDYKLNDDRCDMCNTGCNTTCQASCQQCNVSCISQCYDCGQSGCSSGGCAPSVSGCIAGGDNYGPLGMVCW